MVIFYHASVRNVKKIILSYIYVELCYSENEIFHIFRTSMTSIRRKRVKGLHEWLHVIAFQVFLCRLYAYVVKLIMKNLREEISLIMKNLRERT